MTFAGLFLNNDCSLDMPYDDALTNATLIEIVGRWKDARDEVKRTRAKFPADRVALEGVWWSSRPQKEVFFNESLYFRVLHFSV